MDHGAFKEAVKLYVDLHGEIDAQTKRLRDIKKQQAQLADSILEYMKLNKVDACELADDGGKLVRTEAKRTEGLKKEHIEQELLKEIKDPVKVSATIANIFSRRSVVSKDVLKKTK